MKLTPDDPKLTAYALGELPEIERAAVEMELSGSPECRQAVQEIRQAGAQLTEELAAEPCPELQSLPQSVLLPVGPGREDVAQHRPWTDVFRRLVWKPTLALVGTAAAMVVVAWWWSARPTRPLAPVSVAVQPTNASTVTALNTAIHPMVVARAAAPTESSAPLPLTLPMPSFKGTPDDLPKGPNIEPWTDKPRGPFLAPVGVKNLALNKKVTSSDRNPITGDLSQITDGNKEAIDDAVVELHKNVQWVQIDLEQPCQLYALAIWHDHRYVQVFRGVVVQTADDSDFTQNVQTLFNNDSENVAGLGIGKDKQYFETHQGKLVSTKGINVRYLRFYSKGSNASALNCYTEIEAWGFLPVK